MLFFLDEDVTEGVVGILSSGHEVRLARNVFGQSSKDAELIAYARSEGAIFVTADGALASPLRQNHRCACLYLKDLGILEERRVAELLDVIESEARTLGDRFFMSISKDLYMVGR